MAEKHYLRNASDQRTAEAAIRAILAKLKAGLYANEAYELADRTMLETYLNRGTK
jgi:hypothetical protein